ncbi:STAS domain-containing protein [Streptomyces sp. NPDC056309]|uniref:STAS domain-containing protein n=1 Tax=unclassified Streptomyces TaxID=2593676 RepID=UPI0035D6F279
MRNNPKDPGPGNPYDNNAAFALQPLRGDPWIRRRGTRGRRPRLPHPRPAPGRGDRGAHPAPRGPAPAVADVRLEFSRLESVDSSGLSALLQIRRLVDEAGVALHLDERPAVLERLLDMTGTLELLTCRPENTSAPQDISASEDATGPARPPAI